MTQRSTNSSDSLTIRLQFPDGRSEEVPVTRATTVEELYTDYVASHVPAGRTGQLMYMGRPLAPPTSTMASHGITTDTVVQIFMRSPVVASADGDSHAPADAMFANGRPINRHALSALFGFALTSAWIFFFLGSEDLGEEEDEGEWEDLQIIIMFCLVFLSIVFVISGGLRQLINVLM